jgi:ABC-type amino acid transport substrate-binding protein
MRRWAGTRWLPVALLATAALVVAAALVWAGGAGARRDTWDRVQTRRVLRVGMDASYPPFEWLDHQGHFQGMDVALARALAARWQVELDLVNIHFDGLYDALYTGRVDLLLSALPYDRMLTRDVLYSQSYFAAGQVLLVAADHTGVQSANDLRGRAVAVEMGATGHQLARTLDRDRGLGLAVMPFRELDEAARAVVAGQADALVCDRVSAMALLAAYPLRTAGEPLTDEPFVMAVRPDSPRLLREINAALAEWRADGTLERLSDEWLVP